MSSTDILRQKIESNQKKLLELREAYLAQECQLKSRASVLEKRDKELDLLRAENAQMKQPRMCDNLITLDTSACCSNIQY